MEENTEQFSQFLTERLKERNLSLRRLSELTGIALKHLENLARGDFKNLPSMPYVRGYVNRLGEILGFNAEEWWRRLKDETEIKSSGTEDRLPKNRFIKRFPTKIFWLALAGVLVLAYVGFRFARLRGLPQLAVTYPPEGILSVSSSQITVAGYVKGADTLYVNGEEVPLAGDGSWNKNFLLQSGLNTVEVKAKKFLGGESDIVRQINYEPAIPFSAPTKELPP